MSPHPRPPCLHTLALRVSTSAPHTRRPNQRDTPDHPNAGLLARTNSRACVCACVRLGTCVRVRTVHAHASTRALLRSDLGRRRRQQQQRRRRGGGAACTLASEYRGTGQEHGRELTRPLSCPQSSLLDCEGIFATAAVETRRSRSACLSSVPAAGPEPMRRLNSKHTRDAAERCSYRSLSAGCC